MNETWGHYAKWNKSDRERQICTVSLKWCHYVESKSIELTHRNRIEWLLPGAGGDFGQRVQTFSYKVNSFWGSNIYSKVKNYQYFIVNLKFAKRADLKCPCHSQKIIIEWGDGCVN